MEDLNKAFEGLDKAPVEETATVETGAKEATESIAKEENNKMFEIYKETVGNSEAFKEVKNSMSDSVEIVKTCGYSDKGDQIYDAAATKAANDGKRKLAQVGRIVGYIIKNKGKEPIKYTTSKCTKKADGIGYDMVDVEAVIAPGKEAQISKANLLKLAAGPEFSFQFANGSMKKAPRQRVVGAKTFEELKDKFFFTFDSDVAGSISVHDDEVKVQIAEKNADGVWLVKPEYAGVLGFAEKDPTVKGKGGRTAGGVTKKSVNSKDVQANYVNLVLQGKLMGGNM